MKTIYNLLFICLLILWLTACKKDDRVDIPSHITIQFYTGSISSLDSATLVLVRGSQKIEKKFMVKNDTASVKVSALEPGKWHVKIKIYTPLPAGETIKNGLRYVYRMEDSLTVSRWSSIVVYSSPVQSSAQSGVKQAEWLPFYAYVYPDLYWLLPKDPCMPHFEIKSVKYNYFYNDRAYYASATATVPFLSQAREYHRESTGPTIEDAQAFDKIKSACAQQTWAKAEAYLIAMNDGSGEEITILHRW